MQRWRASSLNGSWQKIKRQLHSAIQGVGDGDGSYASIALQNMDGTQMSQAYFFYTVYGEVQILERDWQSSGTAGEPSPVDAAAFIGVNGLVCRDSTTNQLVSQVTVPVGDDVTQGMVTLGAPMRILLASGGSTFGYHGSARSSVEVTINPRSTVELSVDLDMLSSAELSAALRSDGLTVTVTAELSEGSSISMDIGLPSGDPVTLPLPMSGTNVFSANAPSALFSPMGVYTLTGRGFEFSATFELSPGPINISTIVLGTVQTSSNGDFNIVPFTVEDSFGNVVTAPIDIDVAVTIASGGGSGDGPWSHRCRLSEWIAGHLPHIHPRGVRRHHYRGQ